MLFSLPATCSLASLHTLPSRPVKDCSSAGEQLNQSDSGGRRETPIQVYIVMTTVVVVISGQPCVDLLRLVSSQLGAQWVAVFQSLAGASEGEVGAICRGHASEGERAQAALSTSRCVHARDASCAALHPHPRLRSSTEGSPSCMDKIATAHGAPTTAELEAGRCTASYGSLTNSYSQLLIVTVPVIAVTRCYLRFDANQLMPSSVNMSQSPVHKHLPPLPSPASNGGGGVARGFFPDESEPLLRCDSTSSKDSALSRTGSFITKERKDTVLRQVRLDPCDLQPVFDDMLHILNPQELQVIEEIPAAEDKLDRLFEIAGTKSQEASQTLLDSVYSHLPDLL
ncbi:unnamed protein product [Arctogadus glacialis]